MKVLYLSPTGTLGGAEKVLLSVLKGVRQTQPDAHLHLLSLSDGPLLQRAAGLGVDVVTLPIPGSLEALGDSQLRQTNGRAARAISLLGQMLSGSADAWRFLANLRRTIRQVGPDLIHSNGIKTHCLAALAHDGKAPVVWHVHDFFNARPLARRLLRLASRRMAAAIAISPAVSTDLEALGLAQRTHVIANTVDVNEYYPALQDGALLDELAGLPAAPAGCLRVGLVATYARWKGHDVFLEAIARLASAHPERPLRCYIVGGPIYQTRGSQFDQGELRNLARRLGIGARVGFIDFQANIVPIYRALDVVVHASTAPEPFGLTIIEAMACGKPVIASMAGGVADIIQNTYDSSGVAPGDVNGIVAALECLAADPQLRRQLGVRARESICQRFADHRVGPQIQELYRSLTGVPQIPQFSSSSVQKVFMHP